jgi:hypothetical protein
MRMMEDDGGLWRIMEDYGGLWRIMEVIGCRLGRNTRFNSVSNS